MHRFHTCNTGSATSALVTCAGVFLITKSMNMESPLPLYLGGAFRAL